LKRIHAEQKIRHCCWYRPPTTDNSTKVNKGKTIMCVYD
jgi:hypothetical protein